jgi:hypothetical protein
MMNTSMNHRYQILEYWLFQVIGRLTNISSRPPSRGLSRGSFEVSLGDVTGTERADHGVASDRGTQDAGAWENGVEIKSQLADKGETP